MEFPGLGTPGTPGRHSSPRAPVTSGCRVLARTRPSGSISLWLLTHHVTGGAPPYCILVASRSKREFTVHVPLWLIQRLAELQPCSTVWSIVVVTAEEAPWHLWGEAPQPSGRGAQNINSAQVRCLVQSEEVTTFSLNKHTHFPSNLHTSSAYLLLMSSVMPCKAVSENILLSLFHPLTDLSAWLLCEVNQCV